MPFTGVLDKQGTTTTYDSGATSTDNGPTGSLWKHFQARGEDTPRYGFTYHDDFRTLATGVYTVTNATAGTFALDTTVGNDGVGLADCASTTVTQGVQIQGGPAVAPAAGRKIGFEALVKGVDIATGPEFFLGLSIVDTTIIATSANSSTDHVGFESVSDDGVLLFHTEDGGTRVSGATSPHTLVEDTYVKLGFLIEGVAGNSVTVYVNGVKTGVAFTADPDIPDGSILVPSLVCQSDGATDSIVHIDWWRVGVTSL
jgi:hypothetical protein